MIGLQKKQRWQHTSFCSWDPGFVITSLFGNNRTLYISLIYFLIKNRILYKLYILGYFSNHCMWRNSEPTQGLMSHFQPMTETIVETLAGLVVRQVLHHPPYLLAILPVWMRRVRQYVVIELAVILTAAVIVVVIVAQTHHHCHHYYHHKFTTTMSPWPPESSASAWSLCTVLV